MHWLKTTLKFLVPILAFGFLGVELYKLTLDIDSRQLSFRLDMLACSLLLLMLLFFADAMGWNLILRSLQQQLPWNKALYIWFYSSLSRYVPGVIWPYLSRIQMCGDQGINKATAATSMMLENLLLAGSSLILSSPLLILYFKLDILRSLGFGLVALAGLALVVCLSRSRFAARFVDRYLFSLKTLRRQTLLLLALYYLAFWLTFGYCFLLFCQSITKVDSEQLFLIALAFPVSFAIGFIASISPGGLGIREGVLYTLLAPQVGSANAALIAVTSRIWLMSVELLIAMGIAAALMAKRGLRSRDS